MNSGRLLAALLALLAALAIGYRWGATATKHARDALELQAEQQEDQRKDEDTQRYQEAVRNGNKAATAAQDEHRELLQRFTQLQGAFNAARQNSPLSIPPVPPSECAVVVAPRGGVELSRRAVWMWNSALQGRDAPAGACGAADTSAESCAAGAGLGLEDAWENHAANAASCAADRQAHQRLIDFIHSREKTDD